MELPLRGFLLPREAPAKTLETLLRWPSLPSDEPHGLLYAAFSAARGRVEGSREGNSTKEHVWIPKMMSAEVPDAWRELGARHRPHALFMRLPMPARPSSLSGRLYPGRVREEKRAPELRRAVARWKGVGPGSPGYFR